MLGGQNFLEIHVQSQCTGSMRLITNLMMLLLIIWWDDYVRFIGNNNSI